MWPPQKYYSVFSFFGGNSFAIMLGYWSKYNNSGLWPIVLLVSVPRYSSHQLYG